VRHTRQCPSLIQERGAKGAIALLVKANKANVMGGRAGQGIFVEVLMAAGDIALGSRQHINLIAT
jgi:hypothetical protein